MSEVAEPSPRRRVDAVDDLPETGVWPSLGLTAFLVAVLAAVIYGLMLFLTGEEYLKMHVAYWLVPAFGGLGGGLRSLLGDADRAAGAQGRAGDSAPASRPALELQLASINRGAVRVGFVGDVAIGIGGAFAAAFLFGGTLNFNVKEPNTLILLVSVSLLAGAFGRRVIEVAGQRLLDQASRRGREAGEQAGRQVVNQLTGRTSALVYLETARSLMHQRSYREALDAVREATAADPDYATCEVERGRILHRMNRTREALEVVREALRRWPDEPHLLYNEACYANVEGEPREQVLLLLERALRDNVSLKRLAVDDQDLKSLWRNKRFKELTDLKSVTEQE